jgi:hypothetical protein
MIYRNPVCGLVGARPPFAIWNLVSWPISSQVENLIVLDHDHSQHQGECQCALVNVGARQEWRGWLIVAAAMVPCVARGGRHWGWGCVVFCITVCFINITKLIEFAQCSVKSIFIELASSCVL